LISNASGISLATATSFGRWDMTTAILRGKGHVFSCVNRPCHSLGMSKFVQVAEPSRVARLSCIKIRWNFMLRIMANINKYLPSLRNAALIL
jgi:hypothetical protein